MVDAEDSKSFVEKRGGSSPSTPTKFNPKQRALEKQRAREQDDEDLRTGRVTREELSQRNGFFSSLDIANSKIILRD